MTTGLLRFHTKNFLTSRGIQLPNRLAGNILTKLGCHTKPGTGSGICGVVHKDRRGAASVMTKKVLVSLMAPRMLMRGLRFQLRYGNLEQFGLVRKQVSGRLVENSFASSFDIKILPRPHLHDFFLHTNSNHN
jgi:hypothetical protein